MQDGIKFKFKLDKEKRFYTLVKVKAPNALSIGVPKIYDGKYVTAIADRAFEGCNMLRSAEFPDSVTSVGSFVFAHCDSLRELTVPDSVTSVGERFLSDCYGLERVTVCGAAVGHLRYNYRLESVDIISGEHIPAAAFRNMKRLKSVRLPEKLKSIGAEAFSGCAALEAVDIPNGTDTICRDAFCGCTRLVELFVPKSVNSIEVGALSAAEVVSLTVDEDNRRYISTDNCVIRKYDQTLIAICSASVIPTDGSVLRIGERAFAFSSAEVISIPDGITDIATAAFYGAAAIRIKLPASLSSISEGAFDACDALGEIDFGGTQSDWREIGGEHAFSSDGAAFDCVVHCSDGDIAYAVEEKPKTSDDDEFFDDEEYDDDHDDEECESENAEREDGSDDPLKIEEGKYEGNKRLTRFVVPDGVTEIGEAAFFECVNLKTVVIAESVVKIGDMAFCDSGLTEIHIPDGVKEIGIDVFSDCGGLNNISVGNANTAYRATNNCLINIAERSIVTAGNAAQIPDDGSVEMIEDGAFSSRSGLSKLVVPSSVRSIGDHAFRDYSSLNEIEMREGVEIINDLAFWMCEELTRVSLPSSLKRVGYDIFQDCDKLKEVHYAGTRVQWRTICGENSIGKRTVHCSDGDIR